MVEAVNPSMMYLTYYKKVCKYHNVSTTQNSTYHSYALLESYTKNHDL
jgi:hypothetical protein